MWTVRRVDGATWMTKDVGSASIDDRAYVQLLKTYQGQFKLRTFR
jgi:hypothetical protein